MKISKWDKLILRIYNFKRKIRFEELKKGMSANYHTKT